MKSVFPLFDRLFTDTEHIQRPLQYEEKMQLCHDIKDLDQEGHELLYAIMRNFYLVKENGRFESVPYSPKLNKTGYKFDTTYFPPRLLIMMRHFVSLHLEKVKEQQMIDELQSQYS
jgi:hypothetical protein